MGNFITFSNYNDNNYDFPNTTQSIPNLERNIIFNNKLNLDSFIIGINSNFGEYIKIYDNYYKLIFTESYNSHKIFFKFENDITLLLNIDDFQANFILNFYGKELYDYFLLDNKQEYNIPKFINLLNYKNNELSYYWDKIN